MLNFYDPLKMRYRTPTKAHTDCMLPRKTQRLLRRDIQTVPSHKTMVKRQTVDYQDRIDIRLRVDDKGR